MCCILSLFFFNYNSIYKKIFSNQQETLIDKTSDLKWHLLLLIFNMIDTNIVRCIDNYGPALNISIKNLVDSLTYIYIYILMYILMCLDGVIIGLILIYIP